MLQIKNDAGRKFNVRVVMVGDSYGREGVLTHNADPFFHDDPLVEFYDAKYPHTEYGQFISRYYLGTLAGRPEGRGGLCLQGDVAEWQISETNVREAIAYAKGSQR
tara:strand:+ start:4587 stop:4904 length:318 start_codon:yes stop_codon:yes gene_type:complete